MPYLIFIHSLLRYFILLFAVIVVIQSLAGILGKKKFGKANKMTALFLLICCDIQLLAGLALYYTNFHTITAPGFMKDTYNRFYAVEHSVSMILAIILVHVGYNFTKKNLDDQPKFKRVFWSIFVALAIFFAMIPWQQKPVVGKPNVPTLSS